MSNEHAPRYAQTDHFAPPHMIPAFNELGNHPADMSEYVRTRVSAAYERLGIEDRYPEAEVILLDAIRDLDARSPVFRGHHLPSTVTRRVLHHGMDTFVRESACEFDGQDNYAAALELQEAGHTVVLAPNHTSPLDALVPLTLFNRSFPKAKLPALLMSQVFEYARITRLLTSGVEKYPIFQPKHMAGFGATGHTDVVADMRRQNITTLWTLHRNIREGGRGLFFYLEKNRNTDAMGVPEPAAAGVLDLLERAKTGCYILPLHISGIESIFPNRPGTNEIDRFYENIQIGSGAVACGAHVPFSRIVEYASATDRGELVEAVIPGEYDTMSPKQRRFAAISIATLGLVARLAPSEQAKGRYGDPPVANLAAELHRG